MPIINMPVETLLRLVNVGDAALVRQDQLAARLEEMGVEVEEVTQTEQFTCARCEKVLERTAAQGSPLHCSSCGADFRVHPHLLAQQGSASVLRLNMLAVRPDIFDAGGMARYFRGFLGAQPGLIEYAVQDGKYSVQVDPRLAENESYRPAIACAVLRNLKLDHESIKFVMNLQEDLHWALGRDRKLASIGVYDLSTFRGPSLQYDAVLPDELRFTPLGFALGQADSLLTPAQILEQHKTGVAYAHLLKGMRRYPLLRDSSGAVLSMPPVINSEATRVTRRTTDVFVDVTGLAQRTVDRALAILVTSMKEMMPQIVIERVAIRQQKQVLQTPDLTPVSLALSPGEVCDTIGVDLKPPEIRTLLERMGHGASLNEQRQIIVRVPAWRNDVLHPIDLIEDVAVAYGYHRLAPALVPTVTIAAPRLIEEQSAIVRRIFVGQGFHQVMTLTLTSAPAAFDHWRLPHDPHAVQIENPISSEQTLCRISLLPGLLETLSINKRYDLPQNVFEVGDCCVLDPAVETGARETRRLAAAIIGTHAGYADIRAALDAFAHEMQLQLGIDPVEHLSFIPGRVASLTMPGGRAVGVMGEVHPEVLENYGLKHAVAVLELDLSRCLPSA